MFQAFCRDMGREHHQVLYHAEVCWLSICKVLGRVYELRAEIAAFLLVNKSPLPELSDCEETLVQVAYLVDIFYLNCLNVSMQGRGHNQFVQGDEVEAFKMKLAFLANHVSNRRIDMFPNADFKIQNPINKPHGDTPLNSILSSCRERQLPGGEQETR